MRDGSKSSGGKVRGCILSQKRCHLHKLAAPEKRRETRCDNQSNIHRGWRKRSSRGGRNGVSDGRVWGAVAGERRMGKGGRTYGKERKRDVKTGLCKY